MIAAGIVLAVLGLLAGCWRAVHDVQTHNPGGGRVARWGPFWDSIASWHSKYKNNDPMQGPRFPGATTWLVAFTDGWHLSNLLSWAAADVAVLAAAWAGPRWWPAVAYVAARRLIFQPLYSWLRK